MGYGASDTVGEKLSKEFGVKKAILVYDQGVAKAGLTKNIEKNLSDVGIEFTVFSNVASDPTDTSIEEGGEVARKFGAEAVIGVGGGSVLDTAKGINVLLGNPSPLSTYFLGGKPTAPGKPIFLLPTTSGTGSECTFSCIVTDTKGKRKTTIRSKNCNLATLAVVDPGLTLGLPPHITAMTGADAFTHAAGAMTNNGGNAFSAALAKEAISNLANYLPRAVADGSDREAREKVGVAATMAGMSFANSFPHLDHCFGHSIGATLHLPHGLAVGAAVAQTTAFVAPEVPEKVKALGKAMGLNVDKLTNPADIAKAVGEGILEFKVKIKLPALKDQKDVTKEKVISAYPLVTKDGCYPFSPRKLESDEVTKELLGKMFDNVI
jgi:alcohol dehydrogenase